MSDNEDNEDRYAPKDVTIIENQDVDSTDNRRRNNDQTVADDDADYRQLTETRENEEAMEAKEYDAAYSLLRLSRKPRKVKTRKFEKNMKKPPLTQRRPLMRGKTKKKRKRKKGKSHKKKKISRRGKK